MGSDNRLYTLLNSLARKGSQGAELDVVNEWINSHMFTQENARLAFDEGYILVKNIYSSSLDDKPIPYVYLTKQGMAYLKRYNSNASFGRPKWNPNQRLANFMQNYQNDDD